MTFLDWLFALLWLTAALVAVLFGLLTFALAVTRKERQQRRLARTEHEYEMWLERNDDEAHLREVVHDSIPDDDPIPGTTLPPTHTRPFTPWSRP